MGEFSFEERRLRRKLTFWRGFFLLILFGIGLSVCDEIVTRHGGKLTVANAEGGGCTVAIYLPMAQK